MAKMNNWKKLDKHEMTKIKGGGFWISAWALTLTTIFVTRSLFSQKASIAMNGLGKVNWEDSKPKEKTNENVFDNKNSKYNEHLENFISKFYAV